MLGLHVVLGGNSWAVGDGRSVWDFQTIKCSEHSKWTEADRDRECAELSRYISKLLEDAKVNSIHELRGIPIEATFEGILLKEWRILTEVL